MSPSLPLLCPSLDFSYSLSPTPRLICYQSICRKFSIRGGQFNLEKIFRLRAKTRGLHMLPCGNAPQSIQNRIKLAENQGPVIRFECDSSFKQAPFYRSSTKALTKPYDDVILLKWRHVMSLGNKALGNRYSQSRPKWGGWKNLFNIKLSPS